MKIEKLFLRIALTLLFLGLFYQMLNGLKKEDDDLLFILNLYENQQYNIAKKQIRAFENDFAGSENIISVIFIKAKIAFIEKNYSFSDSLFSELLNRKLDNEMLLETCISKAEINIATKKVVSSQYWLSRAESLAVKPAHKFRIYYLMGKAQAGLLNHPSAIRNYLRALQYKQNDPSALLELLKLYLSVNDEDSASELIDLSFAQGRALPEFIPLINVWLDYKIAEEDFDELHRIENMISNSFKDIDESVKIRLAKIKFLEKDYVASKRLINECTTFRGHSQYLLGLILKEQGEIEKADSIFAGIVGGKYKKDLNLIDSSENVMIYSWLERIKILFDEDPEQALADLKNYLTRQKANESTPYIMYVYGSLLFKNKQYQDAITNLLLIKNMVVSPELKHNIKIMLGNIWFNAKVSDNAKLSYNEYLNMYPSGRHIAHARYNLAIISYEEKGYSEALSHLSWILSNTSNQEVIEKAKYLVAEINFYQANYRLAIQQYSNLSNNFVRQINIDFRLAQCHYYLEDFVEASNYIPKLTIDSTNAFQILMLVGNINFNLNRYNDALDIYNSAFGYSKTDSEFREVNSYIALTLYRLRRFDEATALYLKLSGDAETAESYIVMAAKASFHDKHYQQALMLFNKFIADHPHSEYYNYALANIASIQYNLGDYNDAVRSWISLLGRYRSHQFFDNDEQVILAGIFSGLEWCLKMNLDQSVLDELNDMIDSFNSEYIKFELQYLLLKIYFSGKQWSDLLQMAEELRTEFPEKENNEIRRFVATSLSGLNRVEQADSIYRQIFSIDPTPDVLTEWADLEIKSGNYAKALEKLDRAMSIENNNIRFIKLLEKSASLLPDSLGAYWHKWTPKLDSIPDRAQLIWAQWNAQQSRWQDAEFTAKKLLLNPDYQIRSRAQHIVAVSRYQMKDYDNAIIELYRTIYLYPEALDIVLDAKRLVVKSYIYLNDLSEANKVYSEIKNKLPINEQAELEKLLIERQR